MKYLRIYTTILFWCEMTSLRDIWKQHSKKWKLPHIVGLWNRLFQTLNASSILFYSVFNQWQRYFLNMHVRHTEFPTTFRFHYFGGICLRTCLCIPDINTLFEMRFLFLMLLQSNASSFQNAETWKDYISGRVIMIMANPLTVYTWLQLTEKDMCSTRW